MSLISIGNGSALIEITDRCYTRCAYCFKKGSVHSKASHTPLEKIIKRIDWAVNFTDAEDVYLLGGEPLLHPDFIKICEYIVSTGKKISLITSAVVSKLPHEQANLNYALQLYEQGQIFIEVSYHEDKNHKEYGSFMEQIRNRYKLRRENLKKLGIYEENRFDIISTAVVPDKNFSYEDFLTYVNEIMISCNMEVYPAESEDVKEIYQQYLQHFNTKDDSLNCDITVFNEGSLKIKVRLFGETKINYEKTGPTIEKPKSGKCPAFGSRKEKSSFRVESLIIRADGGMSFAQSQCVDMLSAIINVDIHNTEGSISNALSHSLKQLKSHVYKHMDKVFFFIPNKKADHPFSKMCAACWKTERPWQVEEKQKALN